MQRPVGSTVGKSVFGISVGVAVLFVVWGALFTESLSTVAAATLGFLISAFGWVFILATFGFLVFVIYLAFSRFGKIKLGQDDDEPEFSTVSWVAMISAWAWASA